MSNPRVISPQRVEVHEISWTPPRSRPNGDVFMLLVLNEDGARKEWNSLVHVSPKLKPHFDAEKLDAFDLHDVDLNGPATRGLPLQPEHIVMGVRLKDGTTVTDIPATFLNARRKGVHQALWLAAAAAIGTGAGYPWFLLLTLPAAYIARKALRIPAAVCSGLMN